MVLSRDPNLPYDKDPKQWGDLFAGPLWKTVVEGVDRPAQLKEVRNFDAQVAGDTQANALMALSLSILVLLVYIWVRFGNLKYGTATVIALLHDTLFTIGRFHGLVPLEFKSNTASVPLDINLMTGGKDVTIWQLNSD